MRELKFRAYDTEKKKWIEGASFHILGEPMLLENDIVITQFTGIKDKNGVDIYEGDVLSYPVPITLRDEHVWPHKEWTIAAEDRFMKVVFDQACFWVLDSAKEYSINSRCGLGWANTKEMAVVGNIFEEKEHDETN